MKGMFRSLRWLLFVTLLVVVPVAGVSAAVRVDVVSNSGDRIVLDYRIGPYQSETVTIGGEEYQRILLPGEAISLEKGAPALPHVNRSVIIPDDARMEVRILSVQYQDLPARIVPSKGALPRTVDPARVPYKFGEAYHEDAFYPAQVAALGEPYILRDHRGIVVQLDPFRYNPVQEVLRVYTAVTLEITSVGPGERNVLRRRPVARKPVEAFEDLYRSHFLNYTDTTTYAAMDEHGEMLVICYDPWLADMDAFQSHKETMGIPTSVVGVSTIGNDPASIKDYIQSVYDTRDLAFVLLVGDAQQVATPARQVGGESGASDPWYAKLAGNDDYPDIMVGRFSAQTAAQLQTQTERTITYEDLPAIAQDWYWRGTGIGSAQGAGQGDEGQSDKEHIEEIRGWLLADGYTLVDQIYDPGATDTQVSNALNAGRGIVNYCGHGSATSWGTTGFNNADVNNLVNDNMLPFIFSVACNNGEFHHYDECFAEAWLRATHDGVPTGAVAMYASSVSQSWAPPMEAQDEFNLLLTDPARPYHSFGTLAYAGSCSMMDQYGSGGVEMFDTWIVFGDPSVYIVGDAQATHGLDVQPGDGLTSTGPAGGPYDPVSITYTLYNRNDTPLDYQVDGDQEWVSVTDPTGTIPGGGNVQVVVSLNDASRNLDCGTYHAIVNFVNLTDHDGDTTRPVTLTVGSNMTLRQWNMDSDPGWSTEGEWAYGTPTGEGGGHGLNPDPTSGATGTHVYGANLNGDISKAPGGPYYLTVGPLDLTGVTGTTLTFQRWLNTFGPPDFVSNVEVSAGGTTWNSLWSAPSLVADTAWTSQSFALSAADGSPAAYVRWGYQVVARAPHAGSGWNVDDVVIEGSPGSVRIEMSVDPDQLSWNAAPGAVAYDVIRGDVGTLRATGGDFSAATEQCVADDVAGTVLSYTDNPPVGAGHWLLVRAVSFDGPMTWQTLAGRQVGLRDDEIEASGVSCP